MRRLVLLCILAAAAPGQETLDRKIGRLMGELGSLNPKTRLAAARQLAKLGPVAARAGADVVQALNDQDDAVRAQIIEAAVAMGPAVVPHLGPALTGTSRYRARAVLDVFAKLRRPEFIEPHLETIFELLEKDLLRRAAARALAAYSETKKPLGKWEAKCLALLKHEDPQVVAAMGLLLRRAGPKRVPKLISAFVDKRAAVRSAAAVALSGVGEAAVPRLVKTLAGSGSWRRKAGAAEALGRIGPAAREAAPMLLAMVRTATKEELRVEAARALGRIGELADQAIPVLVKGFDDDVVRAACVDGVAAYGEAAVPFLLKEAATKRRAAAVAALSGTGAALTAALQSKDVRVRRMAVDALVHRGEMAPLEPLLSDADAGVRLAVATALARFGRKETEPILRTGLKSADALERRAAVAGLTALGKAGPDVDKLVEDRHVAVRAAAAYARWLRDGDAKAALAPMREGVREHTWADTTRDVGRLGQAAAPAIPDLARALAKADAIDVRLAAIDALRAIVRDRGLVMSVGRGTPNKLDKAYRKMVESGLLWLARAQYRVADKQEQSDGRWSSSGHEGHVGYDLGVTSIAVLAFLGVGHVPREGTYGGNLEEALAFILRHQQKDGFLKGGHPQRPTVEHAFAVWALVETCFVDGRPVFREAAQRGLDWIGKARNPDMAWRYRARDGTNSTNVTALMVTALRIGECAGLRVDREAYRGAAQWIEKMTDPNFGQVGYNYPGGAAMRVERNIDKFPPEKTQSMTAAGCWCRYLMGQDDDYGMRDKGSQLMLEVAPVWDPHDGGIDLYYWHFGSLAIQQASVSRRKKWFPRLQKALEDGQRPDGSWDPIGAWGFIGGRAYATATAILAVTAPHRYGYDFLKRPPYIEPYDQAHAALVDASRDPNPRIAAAAAAALEAIE